MRTSDLPFVGVTSNPPPLFDGLRLDGEWKSYEFHEGHSGPESVAPPQTPLTRSVAGGRDKGLAIPTSTRLCQRRPQRGGRPS